MGKRWELLESNRVANSSTLFWSRNFNLGEKTISRVIIDIPWEYFKNLHQRRAWSHLIWDEGGCTFKEGVQLFVFHSVQCLFTSKQLDDFGKPGTHDMIFCPFTVCSNFLLEALTIHRPWAPSSQSVNGKLRHLWMLISSLSPTQTFFFFLSLPTYWKINQNYGRKRLVAEIQDSLQCWMKQVQICFYYFMAPGKILTPNFGGFRNSAKYVVKSQRVVAKVSLIKCILTISAELCLLHHHPNVIKFKS